jgi:class 3 adenylate cyclase
MPPVAEVPCFACGASVPPGARFCPSCGAKQADEVEPSTVPSSAGPDELRPVTALFADVVGSTALGERLSPGEIKALIGECVSRMSHAVEEFGGTIQAYMGDGIAAYFGLPVAHEDDHERAARAALRILEVVGEYAHDIEDAWGIRDFNVRVGINGGQVGVGLVGGASPQEVGLGDAANVAARLQSAAAPGAIAVGESTAGLLAPGFVLEPLGDIEIKGREAPVQAWQLDGARTHRDPEYRTPLVGREAEMERLRQVLEELVAGRGEVVSLVGEVGVGKTRLMNELEAMAAERVTWLEGRCQSYGTELLYQPFVEMLRNWLGVGEGEAEVAVRTRLRARMNACLGTGVDEVIPFLGRLLSLRLEPESEERLRELSAHELAEGIRGAFVTWIEALASRGPVAVAVDDLHWADPSTRELAQDLLSATDRSPLLVVTTFRPDPSSEAWAFRLKAMADYPHRSVELSLGPIPERAAREMAEAMTPGGEIDEATMVALVKRAEGNPLYLEELLRGLIESGALARRRNWTLTVDTAEALPPALESLLVSRIDRLPPEPRRLIQIAAVIGRTFPVRVLEQVAGRDDLEEELAVLLRASLIREARRYPELEYTFRHGLLQEAALATLPAPSRRELSGRVAGAYEATFPEQIDDHLEVLAHHYGESLELGKALDYLERAGERAASLDAIPQARETWERARAVAERLGDQAARERIEPRIDGLGSEEDAAPSAEAMRPREGKESRERAVSGVDALGLVEGCSVCGDRFEGGDSGRCRRCGRWIHLRCMEAGMCRGGCAV